MHNRSTHGQLESLLSVFFMAFVLVGVATLFLSHIADAGETKAPTFSKAQVYEALNMVEASGKKSEAFLLVTTVELSDHYRFIRSIGLTLLNSTKEQATVSDLLVVNTNSVNGGNTLSESLTFT